MPLLHALAFTGATEHLLCVTPRLTLSCVFSLFCSGTRVVSAKRRIHPHHIRRDCAHHLHLRLRAPVPIFLDASSAPQER